MSKLPHDEPDPPIGDDVLVYRLVPTTQCNFIDGQWVFQSAAFDNASPESDEDCPDDMSVVLGDRLAELGRSPKDLPTDSLWAGEKWGVAALPVQYLRDEEQQKPLRTPEEDEQAHGDICGKKAPKRRKRLKKHASWIVEPAADPDAN